MAARDDSYSRFVAMAKVMLPLGALGLLSTIFLFSGEVDPTQSIPYTELNVDALVREQRISAPFFSGVTNSGAAIIVTAATAKPDVQNPARFTANDLLTRISPKDGRTINIASNFGDVDTSSNRIRMSDGLKIEDSEGLTITTEAMTGDLKTSEVITDGEVVSDTHFGQLNAGQLHILPPTQDKGAQWVFQNGVKLVYDPGLSER